MRKIEPLRSKVTGPLADLLRFLSLRRVVSDLGRLPAHPVLHRGEPGQVDGLPDYFRGRPAEFFDHLVKFSARLFIHAYGYNFHGLSVTRSVLHAEVHPAGLHIVSTCYPYALHTSWRRSVILPWPR